MQRATLFLWKVSRLKYKLIWPVRSQSGSSGRLLKLSQNSLLKTDEVKATTVTGVFAFSDAARAAKSVTLAAGDSVMAGVAAHQSLIWPPKKAISVPLH